jgi:plasmid stabilization system protein ParE
MDRKIVVSKTAEKKLNKLFLYLEEEWSLQVKQEFVEKLDNSIAIIKKQPKVFPVSSKEKNLRKCVITKQTTLFYRFDSKKIYILTIFDTRQHPNRLNKEI